MRPFAASATLAVMLLLLVAGGASARRGRVYVQSLGRFDQPVYLTAPPGDPHREFVVERAGRVLIVNGRRRLRTPFLDMTSDVLVQSRDETVDQRGLLSLAFAPDYARSGRFYVFYTGRDDMLHVDELRRSRSSANRADPASRRRVLDLGVSGAFHQGGQLAFGPDGMLYVGAGDGGDGALAQDLASLRGKILRIDPRLPAGTARPSVFAYGVREPWRFSFAPRSGDLVLGDVGDETAEEIDVLPRNRPGIANLGWPLLEGDVRMQPGAVPEYVPPVLQELHSAGWCALIGGYVDRDRSTPSLYGRYVFGDVCSGLALAVGLRAAGAGAPRSLGITGHGLASFGEDGRGRLYEIEPAGRVLRLAQG